MADHFLALLARIAKLEGQLRELTTRVPALQIATVTDISEARRMIRVTREAQGAQSQSDWIQAGRRSCFEDEPLPPVGTTVLVGFGEGNPHDGYLLRTLTNDTNPADPVQALPAKDLTTEIPGDDRRIVIGKQYDHVEGDRTQQTQGTLNIRANESIAVDASVGAVELTAIGPTGRVLVLGALQVMMADGTGAAIEISAGTIQITDAAGRKWTMSQGQWKFDLGGSAFHITNASDVTINGKSVAVVGAPDTDGDLLTDRGY